MNFISNNSLCNKLISLFTIVINYITGYIQFSLAPLNIDVFQVGSFDKCQIKAECQVFFYILKKKLILVIKKTILWNTEHVLYWPYVEYYYMC